jgi:NAD(P)H-dependent FMN reductase
VLQASARLAPPDVQVEFYAGLAGLPPFNPDLDTETPPESVVELRRLIGACDGLLISSPEYAHGIPGVLKNALDWLVSSLEFADTPTALINPSIRSVHAVAQLREVLTTMSAALIEPASITLDMQGRGLDAEGIAADPVFSVQLREAMARFVEAIRAGKTSG